MKKIIKLLLFVSIILGLSACIQPVSEVVKIEVLNWPEASASVKDVFRAYFTDQSYDLSDVRIKVTYSDNSTQTLSIDDVTIRGDFLSDQGILYLMQQPGIYEIRVSYGGVILTLSYEVRVRPTIIAGGIDHPTIQSAIDEAVPGDVIYILEGLYKEELLIQNKSNLTIMGAGQGKTIIAPNRAYAVNNNGITMQTSDSVTISDLTIDGFANSTLGEVSTFRDGIHFHNDGGGNNHVIERLLIRNIDRRGISVWRINTQNTTIRDNTIENMHGLVMGTFSGGVGIVLHGTGTVKNNLVRNVFSGIISNSEVLDGRIEISDNTIQNIKTAGNLTSGISVWAYARETYIISNNTISSSTNHFQGMYINFVSKDSKITNNQITMTGEHGVGMELINNRNGGYLVENNVITTARSNVGILLAQVGSQDNPMVVKNNTILNTSNNVDFDNVYHWIPSGTVDLSREVGILVSSSFLVQRVTDTNRNFHGEITNNTIQGYKEALALIVDTVPTFSLNMVFEDNIIKDYDIAVSYAHMTGTSHQYVDNDTYSIQDVTLNFWGTSQITSMMFNGESIIFNPWYISEDMDTTNE